MKMAASRPKLHLNENKIKAKLKLCNSVTPKAYQAIQSVDVEALASMPEWELRPLLPCLVRTALCCPLDQRAEWSLKKKIILRILSGIEIVNLLVALLSIDFHSLESDVRKEQQLRLKKNIEGGFLISGVFVNVALEFERSDAALKLRLVLNELLQLMTLSSKENQGSEHGRYFIPSDLFDMEVYLDEVADVLCIAHSELPGILHLYEIAEAVLHLKHGTLLLCRLIANSPESFVEVCERLMLNGEEQDEESISGRVRMETLHALCLMNPSQILAVRARAIEWCRMPGLAVLLTLEQSQGDSDVIAFVSGLLLGSDDKVRLWFSHYIRSAQKREEKRNTLSLLREELLNRLQQYVACHIHDGHLSDDVVVEANAILRLYCALRGIAGLKFTESETCMLMKLMTSHPSPSAAGIRFVSLGLCMLVACPSLVASYHQLAVDWIQWLIKEESYFGRTSGVNASFGEMLLLMAIHFHSNQIAPVADLVCSTLAMKFPIRPNSLSKIRAIFTNDLFTDQVVTSHAVKVNVTQNLNANMTGFLPVHCIYQLLKSRAFTKHKVPIKEWILRQLCSTMPPIHPILPALIEVYVNSVIIPPSRNAGDATNEPLTDEEILAVFEPQKGLVAQDSPKLAPQLLLLYYLLLYEDVRLANMKSGRKVKKYTADLMTQIPIRYLIYVAQHDEKQHFADLFSSLLRLLASHYPNLCMVDDWLHHDRNLSPVFSAFAFPLSCTPQSLTDAFESVESCPIGILSKLDYLNSIPVRQLWPFAEAFVAGFPLLLSAHVPRQVVERAKHVWWRMNQVMPRHLWVLSINAFRPPQFAAMKKLSLEQLIVDPLHALRCDAAVFRCAPMLETVLHMLRALLAASKTHLSLHLLENPCSEGEKDREELRNALVGAQESAAIQILVEACMLEGSERGDMLSDAREAQTLICAHLHHMFIADPQLVKLVHFQGYPSHLLPITVSLIPSMHICLDFIPELLAQPHLEKQVFAIELTSFLSLQYAIPKSLSIARLCINVANTLLGVLPSEKRAILFVPALAALVRICKVFPSLADDVAIFLLQLGRVCLSAQCAKPNTGYREALERPMATLESCMRQNESTSNSALCQVIHETFAQLCDTAVFNRSVY